MGNVALILTHLVAVANTEGMNAGAETFKRINLAAAASENCVLHLQDEDETPEIVNPELGTLFVSFSIWNDAAASENFAAKQDGGRYLSASWEMQDDKLPSLNEAFGRIALRDWGAEIQTVLPISMFEAAGRRWLQDNVGDVTDPFIYDHWVGAADEAEETASSEKRPIQLFTFHGKKVSFFKHPFGAKSAETEPPQTVEPVPDLTPEVEASIREFEKKMAPYNHHLDLNLAGYTMMGYEQAGSVVNWAWGRINFLNEYIEYSKRYTDKGYPQLRDAVTAELNRWNDAYARFSTHHRSQEQAAVRRVWQKADADRREDDREHQKKMQKINEEIDDINRRTYENTVISNAERTERYNDALFGRERYVILKKID